MEDKMAIRQIIQIGEDTLYKKSVQVTKFDGRNDNLIMDMIDTMNEAGGVGLAAPQVGILKKIIVFNEEIVTENEVELSADQLEEDGFEIETKTWVMINPEILEKSGSSISEEGCLSVKGEYGDVERATSIKVKYQDQEGNEKIEDFTGFTARIVQHEVDHLDGVLFVEKIIKKVEGAE